MTVRIYDNLTPPPGQAPDISIPIITTPDLQLINVAYGWTVAFSDTITTYWTEFHVALTPEEVMPTTALSLVAIDSASIALDVIGTWYARAVRITPIGPIYGNIRRIGCVHEIGAGIFDETFDHTFE